MSVKEKIIVESNNKGKMNTEYISVELNTINSKWINKYCVLKKKYQYEGHQMSIIGIKRKKKDITPELGNRELLSSK